MMTAESDIRANRAAVEIAHRALGWMRQFPTIEAMEAHHSGFSLIDRPEFPYIAVVQFATDFEVKFGHIIMREGAMSYAKAGAMDVYDPDDKVTWIICGYSPHTKDKTATLAPDLQLDSLVHEATHVIDGRRTTWRGARFAEAHMSDLSNSYYCTPHEFNAHYHQGLFSLLNDIARLHLLSQRLTDHRNGRAMLLRRVMSEHWSSHFLRHLNRRYARKMRKRLWRVMSELGPDATMTRER